MISVQAILGCGADKLFSTSKAHSSPSVNSVQAIWGCGADKLFSTCKAHSSPSVKSVQAIWGCRADKLLLDRCQIVFGRSY
jgi:hypothetical protein